MSDEKWQTLSESLAELERTDPAVAESAKRFDEMVDRAAFDTVTRRDLARRALNAEAAVSRVRELHQPRSSGDLFRDYMTTINGSVLLCLCGKPHPCETAEALGDV